MDGDERLVSGDHVLAVLDGAQDQRPRRLEPADELDDDPHLGVVDHRRRVLGEHDAVEREVARLVEIADAGAGDLDGTPGAAADLVLIAAQDAQGPAAHRPHPQESDFDRVHLSSPVPGLRSLRACAKIYCDDFFTSSRRLRPRRPGPS